MSENASNLPDVNFSVRSMLADSAGGGSYPCRGETFVLWAGAIRRE